MEVHAPHHPIMSMREFLVHLSMVTIGILIALGLEQSVEAYHHHELAEEARRNIQTELRDNRKELEEHLAKIAGFKKQRADDIDVVDQFLAHKKLNEVSMALNFSGATLSSASWSTASTVGAMVYMDYAEVKEFAEVYKKQEFFDRLQDEQVRYVQVGLGIMQSFSGPQKPSDEELRSLRTQLLQSEAGLEVLRQLGEQLDSEYVKALGGRK